MTQPPLRVALIGAGRMARAHLRVIQRSRVPAQVNAVFDASPEAAVALADEAGATPYRTLEDLLQAAAPDVVHVCTTAGSHYRAALLSLQAGAHVYAEKPFVETRHEAESLVALAARQGRLICAGHQLLADRPWALMERSLLRIGPIVHVDSRFTFRPPTLRPDAPATALAAQLLDVVPHPLYTLIAMLERAAPVGEVTIEAVAAAPAHLTAVLRAGDASGILVVSLRARPIQSTLTVQGTRGAAVADFIRGASVVTGNPGVTPVEKVVNPVVEAVQLGARSAAGVVRRLVGGAEYPGLRDLIERFHAAALAGGESPVPPAHLVRTCALYEEIAANLRVSVPESRNGGEGDSPPHPPDEPLVVVTGAAGFLGQHIVRELRRRGARVRGVGRGPDPGDPNLADWVACDLSRPPRGGLFAGADAVIHAAAATGGAFAEHQRHTIATARHVLDAAAHDGARRLVLVSSLSVLRPPGWHEVQDETTPRASAPRSLGPYTWGKCRAEELMLGDAPGLGVEVKTVRPGALLDRSLPDLPGLAGRRLFGDWHLGLGRPALPFAACDVADAAAVIAWTALDFESAPPILNLFDPALASRRDLIAWLHEAGWRGRMLWVPISAVAAAWALLTARSPYRTAAWSVLRPRRFDPGLSLAAFVATATTARPAVAPSPP